MPAHNPHPPRFPEPEPGAQIGSWRVQGPMGRGSHGVVFQVVNADRPEAGSYALKLALEPGDPRFEREAHVLSRVSHTSVPRLEGQGTWRSPLGELHPYIVMQRVEGLNLYAWALEHGPSVRQAIRQLAQVARALEATHPHGLHRDVKGGNIRVDSEGHAVLLDYGSCSYPDASPLTGRALPPGTPHYRSPQLLMLEFALELGSTGTYQVQPADDVYALGITAYRLLAGGYPPRDSYGTALPVAPRGLNDVCPELGDLIVQMLAEDPPARGSAGQVAEALERMLGYDREVMDEPWVANATQQATQKVQPPPPPEPPPPEPPRKEQPPMSLVAAGLLLLLALPWLLMSRDTGPGEMASAEPEAGPKRADQPDAGTSMGEEAMASVAPDDGMPYEERGMTREVPSGPLDGQVRPPCRYRGALEINGGCWWGSTEAPCDPTMIPKLYEYEGRCFTPIFKGQRQPTSKDP